MKKQKNETAHGHLKWDQNELIDEKWVQKILWDSPFNSKNKDARIYFF